MTTETQAEKLIKHVVGGVTTHYTTEDGRFDVEVMHSRSMEAGARYHITDLHRWKAAPEYAKPRYINSFNETWEEDTLGLVRETIAIQRALPDGIRAGWSTPEKALAMWGARPCLNCGEMTHLACNSCHKDLCTDHLNGYSGNCQPCHSAIVAEQQEV